MSAHNTLMIILPFNIAFTALLFNALKSYFVA